MSELQLRRTAGTVYGEIMRDSGITLPEGKYITGIDFASGLVNGGVIARRSFRPLLEDVRGSLDYGLKDDRYTGTQIVMGSRVNIWRQEYMRSDNNQNIRYKFNQNIRYTFNPWKEIMGGDYTIADSDSIFNDLANPRSVVKKLKTLYKLFASLPARMQKDLLRELDRAPCDLEGTGALDLTPSQLDTYTRILNYVPASQRDHAADMLRLISAHNICVDKGDIVRREIDHLMGFDVSRVPARWTKGTLDEAVLTEDRVRELKGLLQRAKIQTS